MNENDQETRFRRSYWAVVHSMDTLRLRAWEDRGLTLPQLRILFLLRAHPGATTNALARRLHLTVPTVSGLVEKLAQGGLVERGPRGEDRRVIPLTLTAEGESTAGEIQRASRAYLHELCALLGEDLAPTVEALDRLAAAIEQLESRAQREGVESAP